MEKNLVNNDGQYSERKVDEGTRILRRKILTLILSIPIYTVILLVAYFNISADRITILWLIYIILIGVTIYAIIMSWLINPRNIYLDDSTIKFTRGKKQFLYKWIEISQIRDRGGSMTIDFKDGKKFLFPGKKYSIGMEIYEKYNKNKNYQESA